MKSFQHINLTGSEVFLQQNFLNPEKSTDLFQKLLKEIPWRQDYIKLFGKRVAQPRLTALFGETHAPYTYSGLTMHPTMFTPTLFQIKKMVEAEVEETFSSCLANLYRNGQDSNSWHSDDEKELGLNPVIASLSLGAPRMFHLKHKKNPELKIKLELQSGSLLLMKGETQKNYKHQIPKTKKEIGPRINLTFRMIKPYP